MSDKKKGLVKKAPPTSTEAILSHPVFKDMQSRLETIHSMVQALPEAIGRAVQEANRKPPQGASGPPMPVVPADPKTVRIERRKLTVDGKEFEVKPAEEAL